MGAIGETEAQFLLMPLAKALQLGSERPEFSACSWSGRESCALLRLSSLSIE